LKETHQAVAISAMVVRLWLNQELWEQGHLLSVTADQLMARFPVICRIDQKEKNDGAI
jgi:hypothetical protein